MITTKDGGRKTGFKSGYRPDHLFEIANNIKKLYAYMGDIQFDNQELIYSGEKKVVTVRF